MFIDIRLNRKDTKEITIYKLQMTNKCQFLISKKIIINQLII